MNHKGGLWPTCGKLKGESGKRAGMEVYTGLSWYAHALSFCLAFWCAFIRNDNHMKTVITTGCVSLCCRKLQTLFRVLLGEFRLGRRFYWWLTIIIQQCTLQLRFEYQTLLSEYLATRLYITSPSTVTYQSWWTNFILPVQRQGWKRGFPGEGPDLHTRQMSRKKRKRVTIYVD